MYPYRTPAITVFFPWSNEEQSRCDTEQISSAFLFPTWEVLELAFNYNSAFSVVKKNGSIILAMARVICLPLIPINTFQEMWPEAQPWFSHSKVSMHLSEKRHIYLVPFVLGLGRGVFAQECKHSLQSLHEEHRDYKKEEQRNELETCFG